METPKIEKNAKSAKNAAKIAKISPIPALNVSSEDVFCESVDQIHLPASRLDVFLMVSVAAAVIVAAMAILGRHGMLSNCGW